MKVTYIVSLFPCWSETFIVREIHELIARGVDVRIVSLKHPCEEMVQSDAQALLDRVTYPASAFAGSVTATGEVLRAPLKALTDLGRIVFGLQGSGERIAKSLVVWWRALGLAPIIRAQQPDRLHAHWATYPTTAAQALSARLKVPYGFTCHAHDIFVEQHFVRSKLLSADLAVTISRFNIQFLSDRVGTEAAARLSVVHCGVSPQEIPFEPGNRESDLIVSVGRLDNIKGFHNLVAACAQLKQLGKPFRCVIIGEGPLRATLQAQIEDAGLRDLIEMPGSRPGEQVRALLARAALFVLPCRVTEQGDRDGIPVALMEAMASGAPVVSTTVSGIPELIRDQVNGLLVAPDDPDALAAAIDQVLSDPAAAASLARLGRETIEQDFDVAREAGKLLGLFESRTARRFIRTGEQVA